MSEERETYKLKKPIQNGTETITEFQLRPFKAKDLRRLTDMTEEEKTLKLISRLSGQPDQVVDELGGADLTELSKMVEGFF